MVNRTSLGMLMHNNDKLRHISDFSNDYGIDWDYCDWNQPIVKNGSPFLLIHQAIVNPKMIGGTSSWIIHDKEFARIVDDELEQYELILCGHWHKKYRFTIRNTTIMNPGPIVRRTIEDTELPTVQLINLENKLRRIIKLKSAKPTELVISDKHLQENIHKVKTDITDFINALKDKKRKYSSSFLDNLMALLDNHEIDKEVEAILRIMVADLIERREG
jgi:predicted phosphodiesterase